MTKNDILVLGAAGNIFLLINKKNLNNENTEEIKAVTVDTTQYLPCYIPSYFETIDLPFKFNDFIPFETSDDMQNLLKESVFSNISEEDENKILDYLK